jgi:hypothetical protein
MTGFFGVFLVGKWISSLVVKKDRQRKSMALLGVGKVLAAGVRAGVSLR